MMPRARRPSASSVDDQLEHLVTGVRRDAPGPDLPLQRLVGADEELLAGLAAGVEGAGHLHAAEGAVVEQAAVLAGERDALRDALVDDVDADLGQAVHVRLARAVVAALDGVVEQPVDRVAVALVVLGRVDAALGGDRVGPARGVLVEERLHRVAGLAHGGRGRGAGEPGADDDDAQLASVGRVDQAGVELAVGPAHLDGAGRRLGVDQRLTLEEVLGGVAGAVAGARGQGDLSHQGNLTRITRIIRRCRPGRPAGRWRSRRRSRRRGCSRQRWRAWPRPGCW